MDYHPVIEKFRLAREVTHSASNVAYDYIHTFLRGVNYNKLKNVEIVVESNSKFQLRFYVDDFPDSIIIPAECLDLTLDGKIRYKLFLGACLNKIEDDARKTKFRVLHAFERGLTVYEIERVEKEYNQKT